MIIYQHVFTAKEAFVRVEKTYSFLGPCLVKDLTTWSELQAGVLRNHCTYLVRLWRKSKNKSKSAVCMQRVLVKPKYYMLQTCGINH